MRAVGFSLDVLTGGSLVVADKSTPEKLNDEFNDWGEIKNGYRAYRG